VNPYCCRTGNLGPPVPERVAGSLRLPPDSPPASRAVTHPDVGTLFQPRAAIAVCVRPAVPPPIRLKSIMQDSPSAHCRQSFRGRSWRRPCSRYPPAWTPSIITAAATAHGRVTRSVVGPRIDSQWKHVCMNVRFLINAVCFWVMQMSCFVQKTRPYMQVALTIPSYHR